MCVIGFSKAILSGNSVPLASELIKPELVMNLYVLKMLVDGVGSAALPYLVGESVSTRI